MRKLWPSFVMLALGAVAGSAQEPQLSPFNSPGDASEAASIQGLLDLEFKLAPVELDISEELTKAKEHYEAGQWQAAIDAATQFLDNNPQHKQTAAGLFLRGESSVQLQRYQDVRRDFKQLLLSNPNSTQRTRAEFRIAEAAMLSEQLGDAQRMFEEFRRRHPSDKLNAYVIAYLAETIGRENPPWAKALYVESIQQYPAGPLNRRARLHLALIRFNEGNHDIARSDLEQLVETGDRSSDEYWTAWYWLARAELKAGKTDSAIDRFLTFSEQHVAHEFTAAALYQTAEAYRKTDRTDQALELYEQVAQDWPSSPYAGASSLGQMLVLKKQGYLDRALGRFASMPKGTTSAIKLQGTQLATEILLAKKEFEQAEALIEPMTTGSKPLQRVAERDAYYTSLYLLALSQRGQGEFSSANELLGRIRLELVSPKLAQRVLLARIETFVAAEDYNQATRNAFDFESRFSSSKLLPAVRTQMVRSLVAQKRFDEANIKLQQLQNTNDADVYIARAAQIIGESAYQRGDYATARNAFTALERHQQSEEAIVRSVSGLAWIDRKQGNHAAAAKRFARFIEAFPDHADVWQIRLAYAETLVELKKTNAAINALEAFETLPAAHPLRPQGLYQLAELVKDYPQQGNRAAEIVDELLADYPEFEQRDAVLYLAATLQRQSGSLAASKTFAEIVENHTSSKYWSDALYRLAETAHSERDNKTAKRYLTKLISAERDRTVLPHALFMKGRLESDEKNWSQARETLRDLLRAYPKSKLVPVARYGVAESFFQEKEFDRAYQLFQILDREKRFENGDAWAAMVQLRLAQLEVQRKNLVQATEIAEQIEQNDPDFSLQHEVDYLIGRVAASRGEFSQAREFYGKVVAADTTYEREITAMAQWMIGESFFHQKKYIVAIKAYEALLADLRYENWQAASHLQIGKCYELLDNLDQATTSYTRVTERYGDSKWAEEAKQRLASLNESE